MNPIFVGKNVVAYVKTIPELNNKIVLFKTIIGSQHLLRHPPAIAFNKTVIKQAKIFKATEIFVTDTESKIKYAVSLEDFEKHAFALNRGHGDQLALALDQWKSNVKKEAELKQPKLL